MMIKNILAVTLLFLGAAAGLTAGQETNKATLKRFAMLVGADDGGKERVQLKYAVSDAKSVSRVFEKLGGVAPNDRILLENPDRTTFFMEMGRLKEKIRKSKAEHSRVEVIVYYSGHSDENHIFLGEEKVPYKDFRDAINSMDAEVRIAILDSCASGAFTRIKGGKKRLPFLVDSAYNMKGFAYMTSSSSDEVSQESDRIRGSFFTHYLLSGLRGAADMSGDGRVTLNEAYQFSFNETLAKTEKTMSGPQHPYYNIEMSGTGDVVMTDIRQSSVLLVFKKNLSGKLFIHDEEEILVAELTKQTGREIELGLEEGDFRIINISDGNVYEAEISLKKGAPFTLDSDAFEPTGKAYTTPRGNADFQSRRRSLLKRRVKKRFFSRAGTKATKIHGRQAWLVGGNVGYIFNNSLSVGLSGYARTESGPDQDGNFEKGEPAYMGVTVGYSFKPRNKIHFKTGALFGAGNGEGGLFYIFEPEIGAVLNLSRTIRLVCAVSMPITSKRAAGLNGPIFSYGVQFGK
ncbi:MAG: caspase family protein [bacterium]|nr:caspase family protein [bacterium]